MKRYAVLFALCAVLCGCSVVAANVGAWLKEVAPMATAYDVLAPRVEGAEPDVGVVAPQDESQGSQAVHADASGSADPDALWQAWLERATRLISEASKSVQRLHPVQSDVPLATYEEAVAKVHAADTCLNSAPQSQPAEGTLEALKQEVAHAHEMLADAEERLKDSGVYLYHGARLAAEREVMTALQELEDARQYLGFIGHTLEAGADKAQAAGAGTEATQRVRTPSKAPVLKVITALRNGGKALVAWASELRSLGRHKQTNAKQPAADTAEKDAACAADDLKFDEAQRLIAILDEAMGVMRQYEHVDHVLTDEEATQVVQTAMKAFLQAVRHMEEWQAAALESSPAFQQQQKSSVSPSVEVVRIAVSVVSNQVPDQAAASPPAGNKVNRWAQRAKHWMAAHKLWPSRPAAQAAS